MLLWLIFATNTATLLPAPLALLQALTVLFKTLSFHTIALYFNSLFGRDLSFCMVQTILAVTMLIADLSTSETVAIVDITLRLEAITVDNFFGYTFLQQIINLPFSYIG